MGVLYVKYIITSAYFVSVSYHLRAQESAFFHSEEPGNPAFLFLEEA